MSVKVVKKSSTVTCKPCRKTLSYTRKDVKDGESLLEYYKYIICPSCKDEVELPGESRPAC